MGKKVKIDRIGANFPDGLIGFLSLLIIFSAGIYYIYALNLIAVLFAVIAALTVWISLRKRLLHYPEIKENIFNISKKNTKDDYLKYWPALTYIILYLIGLYLLCSSRSDRALISPWQVTDKTFFIIYILSSLSLVFMLLKKNIPTGLKAAGLAAHYFLNFTVAAIVYEIGYGFDPFIHQATMELIDKKGLVTPKPFYYLGEYGLIVVLHKLTGISIYFWNKILVPLLAAIFLPTAAYRLTRADGNKSGRWLIPLFLLILTFSPLIATTPQNFSYIFLIMTIAFGLTKADPLWPLLLALATLAIHPLTGIPAIIWCSMLILEKRGRYLTAGKHKLFRSGLWLAGALLLPLALFISGGSDFKEIAWNLRFIIEPIKNLFSGLNTAGQENWLLNFVYFFFYNYNLWLILIIIASLFFFRRQTSKQPGLKSLLLINSSLAAAYLISSQITFNDLINYEQTNFAGRLLVIIAIFFLPFIVSWVQHLVDAILAAERPIRAIWLAFGLALLGASLYASYPRIDRYFNSRGYSTGINDIAAVRIINQSAAKPYVVLANQQVSVAALKELGFDHYYQTAQGPLYFYPIPTGGQLYQFYLDMVYKNPDRKTMAAARKLAGVEESYLVINKYWFQSDRIISAAKLSADSWQAINDEVYIFKYLP